MHPDQAQNTSSGIQGQEATAVADADGECREMGGENQEVGRCQHAIAQLFCVASFVFPSFSVFKVVYHEHSSAFSPSAISVMP